MRAIAQSRWAPRVRRLPALPKRRTRNPLPFDPPDDSLSPPALTATGSEGYRVEARGAKMGESRAQSRTITPTGNYY